MTSTTEMNAKAEAAEKTVTATATATATVETVDKTETSDKSETPAETPSTTASTVEPTPTFKYTSASYPTRSLDFLQPFFAAAGQAAPAVTAHPARCPLDILIVGAGLGGLATAIALARRGHAVRVYEQAPALGEVGAGIQVPPNSGRLLQRWGVMDELARHAVNPDGISFRRWQNGAKIGYTKLGPEFDAVYGAPYHVVHRAHLHSALYHRAQALGVRVVLGSRVVAYDAENAAITLADQSVHEADLVVAADGIRSIAREALQPRKSAQPRHTGYSAYRATVDVNKMRQHPELAWILEKPGLNIWIGDEKHVMTYMIASGQSFNMVLAHRDATDPALIAQQPVDQTLADMRAAFASWDPTLTKIIGLIDFALKWPLVESGAIDEWVAPSGRLLMLGDAAHAMLPYMSEGAAMAVEDGAALAVVLSHVSSRAEVPFALRVFADERMRRAGQMKEASRVNSMLWHFADGPVQQARDAAMRPDVDGRAALASPNQWSDPVTQHWAYGYDAEAVMEDRWFAAVRRRLAPSL